MSLATQRIKRSEQRRFHRAVDVLPTLQQFSQGRLVLWEAGAGVFIARADGVELVAEAGRNPARQETGTGGAAVRGCDVGLREAHTRRGYRVDVRRRYLRVALAAEFAVAEVIGKKNDDVRLCGRGEPGSRGRQQQRDDNQDVPGSWTNMAIPWPA